jgi:predicted alpha/beta superfamily hydrolase
VSIFKNITNPNSEEKYAVIYMLDGFSLKSTPEAVYDNYWGNYLPHMILVGVSNRTRDNYFTDTNETW